MKREIDCVPCGKKWGVPKDPCEGLTKRYGFALAPFSCDGCGDDIPKGTACIAVSVWTDRGGIQYFPWEAGYIEIATATEVERWLDAHARLDE